MRIFSVFAEFSFFHTILVSRMLQLNSLFRSVVFWKGDKRFSFFSVEVILIAVSTDAAYQVSRPSAFSLQI